MSKSNKKTKQNSNKAVVRGQNSGKRQPKISNMGPKKTAPIAKSQKTKVGVPKIVQTKDGCVVTQRELITTLIAPGNGFNILKRLRVNPASVGTFPWLSTIAGSFEQYRFRKLHFEYISRCPTTLAGSVLMSPDYDAQDGSPVNESVQSVFKGTVEDVPWESNTLILLPNLMNRAYKSHFTMSDTRFANTTQDEKTIDSAQVFVSSDTDAGATLGKLWVDYVCELITPQPPVANPASGGLDVQYNQLSTNLAGSLNPLVSTSTLAIRQQDSSDPILNLTQPSGVGGGGTQQIGTFLRDFQGMVTFNCSDNTNGQNTTPTGDLFTSLFNPRTGVTTVLNSVVGGNAFGDANNLGGTTTLLKNNNYRSCAYISALKDDILQIPRIASIGSGSYTTMAANVALAALKSSVPFV
jgi:hypothetical protein